MSVEGGSASQLGSVQQFTDFSLRPLVVSRKAEGGREAGWNRLSLDSGSTTYSSRLTVYSEFISL